MKAVRITAFGPPERLSLTELPDPVPGPGECLIAVQACDTLVLDTMLRAGLMPEPMRPALPWIPGNGVTGRVVALGDGVDPRWLGFTAPDPAEARARHATVTGIEAVQLPPAEFAALTGQALDRAATHELVPVIGQTFPLVDAAAAHAAIEGRHVFGKTLLLSES